MGTSEFALICLRLFQLAFSLGKLAFFATYQRVMLMKRNLTIWLFSLLSLALLWPTGFVSAAETMSRENFGRMVQEAQDPVTRSLLQGMQVSWQLKDKIEQPFMKKEAQLGDYQLRISSGLQLEPKQVQAGLKINF